MYNIVKMSRTVGKRRGQRRIKTRGKYKKKRRNSQKKRNGTAKKVGSDGTEEYGFVIHQPGEFKNLSVNKLIPVTRPKQIGSRSINGYNLMIIEKQEADAEHANNRLSNDTSSIDTSPILSVLKIPRPDRDGKHYVDNIVYEFFVGSYINNNFLMHYPCFIKTGDLLKKQDETIDSIDNYVNVSFEGYTSMKDYFPSITSEKECNDKALYALTLDFVNGKTLNKLKEENLSDKELNNIYFQIYACLYNLSSSRFNDREDQFIHNDLHENNVFIIELNEPIKIKYSFNDENIINMTNSEQIKEFTITTKYIAKLIDYGTSYIPPVKTFDVENTIEKAEKLGQYKEFYNYFVSCGLSHLFKEKRPDFDLYKKYKYTNHEAILCEIINDLNSAHEKPVNEKPLLRSQSESNIPKKMKLSRQKTISIMDVKSSNNFMLHVDCTKQEGNNIMHITGTKPDWIDLNIFGIVSPEKN